MTGIRSLWEILVPAERRFPGTALGTVSLAHPKSHHKVWDEKVCQIASGLTILKTAKGEWVSPSGEKFRDPMIPVRVYCTDLQIKQIAKITLEHYDQEAVMYYRIAEHVTILEAANEKAHQ